MSTSQRSALRRRIGLLSWDPLGSAKKGSRSSFMKKRKTNGTPGLLVLKKRSTRSRFSSAGVSAALLCAVGPAGVRCGGICSANRAQILARAAGCCHLRLCAWHLAGLTVLGASHVRWRLVCRQTQAWCMLGCPPVCMHHLGFDVRFRADAFHLCEDAQWLSGRAPGGLRVGAQAGNRGPRRRCRGLRAPRLQRPHPPG